VHKVPFFRSLGTHQKYAQAGAGNVIGGDFTHLKGIINEVEDKSRVGVCLDTCKCDWKLYFEVQGLIRSLFSGHSFAAVSIVEFISAWIM
jgi:hypothetical protein